MRCRYSAVIIAKPVIMSAFVLLKRKLKLKCLEKLGNLFSEVLLNMFCHGIRALLY